MNLSKLNIKGQKLIHHLDALVKWKNGEFFAPPFVEINPTNACNQRCLFCFCKYLGFDKTEIPGTRLLEVIKEMADAGVKALYFQGTGEPLLNKAVPDAILAGKKAGLGVSLSTNGVLFKEETIKKVLPCLSWLLVGQLEVNPELYAFSHGCSERQFHMVVNNLKKAVALRNEQNLQETILSAHIMPFPYNYTHIYDTVRFAKELGIDYINIKAANQRIENENVGQWPRDAHKTCADQFQRAKEDFEDDSFKVNVKIHEFLHVENAGEKGLLGYDECYGVEFETTLDCDGGIYPCCEVWQRKEYCYGNIMEKTFEDIWRSECRKAALDKFFTDVNPYTCATGGACKQGKINPILWEIKNPPVHKEFI
ncbi:MAG: radical SAM protein [Proteobacteria bacterium]|nr:radical SAM protein [Pseudomonadota bacterium]